jgi:hypothetical protein
MNEKEVNERVYNYSSTKNKSTKGEKIEGKKVRKLSLKLLHEQLGHLSLSEIKKLGYEISSREERDFECESCCRGKMKRKKFNRELPLIKSTQVGDLIHSDICGPIEPMTLGENRYFLTFTDDYSRYTNTFLIKEKSEVFSKFKEYRNYLYNQLKVRIKKLRSDGGGEYISKEFNDYLKEKGILHQYTPPDTPQRNPVSERVNQTILNKARCMMKERKMDKSFWGEAIATATNLKNKSPTKSIKNDTSYNIFHDEKPDYNKLRIFGDKVMIKDNSKKVKKLDDKAKEGLYLDYDDNNYLYRVFNIEKGRVELTRDITFMPKQPRDLSKILIEEEEDDDEESSEEEERKEEKKENKERKEENNENKKRKESKSENEEEEEDVDDDDSLFPRNEERKKREIDKNNNNNIPNTSTTRKSEREKKNVNYEDFKVYNIETDPLTYEEAMKSEKKEEWIRAIEDEKKSLRDMNTWSEINIIPDKPIVKSKWVFKTKINPDGTTKTKARLVAKGFNQIKYENYEETFAPVIRKESLRYLLSFAHANNLEIHHMDVETAFLNGKLEEDIYLQLPEGFDDKIKIVKLNKALYGLKQSSRCWNIELNEYLISNNYKPTESDPCIYIKKNDKNILEGIIGVYVDDCVLIGKKDEISNIKKLLSTRFKMKDLKELKLILGIEIERDEKEIRLFQRNYINKILERFNMSNCRSVETPIEVKENDEQNNIPFDDPNLFRQAVGCLNFLTNTTRPDISFSVNQVARHVKSPRQQDWMNVKRIFRYLKGSINYALVYRKDEIKNVLQGYSDASYAPNSNDRKSIGAYVFLMNGGAITWRSKKQPIVALSSCEAEYIALSDAAKESQWLMNLHKDICQSTNVPIVIFEDNQSAINNAQNPILTDRNKHIQVRYHHIRQLVSEKSIIIKYCPTNDMIADALTKALLKIKFAQHRLNMGVKNYL